MPDRFTKHPPGVDDLLAPPPFGVAETTGDQLLPIATSMEQVLDEDRLPEPEPQPVVIPAPKAVRTEPVAAPVPTAVDVEEPPANSSRTLAAIAVVAVLLGVGGFVWMRQGGDAASPQAQVDAGAVAPAGRGGAAAATADALPTRSQPATSAKALPTELEALRTLSFEERHAGLARSSGDVPVELHIGLDLVQAQQSEEPCRTFSDALSIIESSEDPSTFKWAVEEASVPAEEGALSCKGLSERLAAARGPGSEEDEAAAPRPRARNTKGNTRSKPRPPRRRPAGDSPPPAEPPKEAEPETPTTPPARTPGVATKLDDDLRGLGE